MKDLYDVLIQKEAAIARVRHEIECLKAAAEILEEFEESDESGKSDKPVSTRTFRGYR
jgi:hypothetical protein